jgi:uncharacterized membrane protein
MFMAAPGLFTWGMGRAYLVFMVVGFIILIAATVRDGASKPETALALLVVSNAAYWLSYALFRTRLAFTQPVHLPFPDVFVRPVVATWVLVIVIFLVYELFIFVWALLAKRDRAIAAFGLGASVAQVLLTLTSAYYLMSGF